MCIGIPINPNIAVLYFLVAALGIITYSYTRNSEKSKLEIEKLVREVKSLQEEIKSESKLRRLDKTGLADYAFGGEVTEAHTTYDEQSSIFACGQSGVENRLLQVSTMPGDCWPVAGSRGSAVIKLTAPIIVTNITLEHAPKEILPHKGNENTPKDFTVSGLYDDGRYPHSFGRFTYDISGPEVQTFKVEDVSKFAFEKVRFELLTNYGSDHYTCIYRLRVHGHKL